MISFSLWIISRTVSSYFPLSSSIFDSINNSISSGLPSDPHCNMLILRMCYFRLWPKNVNELIAILCLCVWSFERHGSNSALHNNLGWRRHRLYRVSTWHKPIEPLYARSQRSRGVPTGTLSTQEHCGLMSYVQLWGTNSPFTGEGTYSHRSLRRKTSRWSRFSACLRHSN